MSARPIVPSARTAAPRRIPAVQSRTNANPIGAVAPRRRSGGPPRGEGPIQEPPRLDPGAARQLLELRVDADLLPEVQHEVGVGVDGDDAGKGPGPDGHAEEAALPELAILDGGRDGAGVLVPGTPAASPHVHGHWRVLPRGASRARRGGDHPE